MRACIHTTIHTNVPTWLQDCCCLGCCSATIGETGCAGCASTVGEGTTGDAGFSFLGLPRRAAKMERRPLLLLPTLSGAGACLVAGEHLGLAMGGCWMDIRRHEGSLGLHTCCCGAGCGDLATEERAGLVATLLLA